MIKYKVNPITQQLVDEGIIEFKTWKKPRRVIRDNGEEYTEIVTYTKCIDRRPFTKAFNERWLVFYKFFEGNPKAQMIFLIEHLLAKQINKDYIILSYKDYLDVCDKDDVKPWKQPLFSRVLKQYLEEEFLLKSEEASKYFINPKYFYNGSLAIQAGIKE